MKKNDQFVNEDTYQTLTELNIDTELNEASEDIVKVASEAIN